jgi:hypothetical protein
MQITKSLSILAAAGITVGAFAQACANPVEDTEQLVDSGAADTGATKDSGPADTGVKDTGTDGTVPKDSGPDTAVPDTGPVDAGKPDTGPDAGPNLPGELFDPTAPKEGDPCPAGTPNNAPLDARRCGYCGSQKAFCENGKVGAYGPCLGESAAADRCLPNAARAATCGICGTTVESCDTVKCTWTPDVCENELPNGCPPGEVTYVTGVCATPEQTRKQTCSATCVLGAPEPCTIQPIDSLDVPGAGVTTTRKFTLSDASKLAPRVSSGACPVTTSSSTPYHAVLLKNTTAAAVVIETWASTPVGGSSIDTVTSAYVGAQDRPQTAAAIAACTGTANDVCSTSPCTSSWSGLVGTSAVTIPANGTAVILTNVYASGTTNAGKPYNFNVRLRP